MSQEFVDRLNTVFSSHQEVGIAEIQKDRQKSRRALLEGLSNSCKIFRDILEQPALRNAGSDPGIAEYLSRNGLTDEFLKTEERLLGYTAISPALTRELLALAKEGLRSRRLSSTDWQSDIKPLADEVCKRAAM